MFKEVKHIPWLDIYLMFREFGEKIEESSLPTPTEIK